AEQRPRLRLHRVRRSRDRPLVPRPLRSPRGRMAGRTKQDRGGTMTNPSRDWRDPIDVEPDELDPANPLLAAEEAEPGEDYNPATARPDLEGRADEADVVDQAYEVEIADDEDDED